MVSRVSYSRPSFKITSVSSSSHLVIGQAGRAVVAVGLAVLALPEDAAVHRVGEGPVQPGAVGGGDGRLQLRPLAALHQVQLGALLQGVGGVSVDEAETIAACPQLCPALLAVPVLVTAETGDMLEISRRVI